MEPETVEEKIRRVASVAVDPHHDPAACSVVDRHNYRIPVSLKEAMEPETKKGAAEETISESVSRLLTELGERLSREHAEQPLCLSCGCKISAEGRCSTCHTVTRSIERTRDRLLAFCADRIIAAPATAPLESVQFYAKLYLDLYDRASRVAPPFQVPFQVYSVPCSTGGTSPLPHHTTTVT